MRRRKKVAIGVASVVVVLMALELFCRFYLGLGDPPLSRADPEIEYMFVGPRTYYRFGNTITYNRFSMRSREFDARRKDPAEIRVLVCGDSVINGGALTDQSQLMTTRMEQQLATDFHRPAIVMNVSAGSWGPANYWSYVKRYGIFEADVLVIVISSHDFSDAPTFAPLDDAGPDFPTSSPRFALSEAIGRYLPRYLPSWLGGNSAQPTVIAPSQGQIDQSMEAFRSLIGFAREKKAAVIVAQYPERDEIGQPETEGHRTIREACEALGVTRVDLFSSIEAASKSGKVPYRDVIHPNVLGQELMHNAISPEVEKALRAAASR